MVDSQVFNREESVSPPPKDSISTAPNAPRPAQKASRKRTKTGCLTCRKRRIKCGEERPICSNCTKSKRSCEGYNQRVIFKHPSGAPHLVGQDSAPTGPVPLAPSIGPGYAQAIPTSASRNPQQWSETPMPRQPYGHQFAGPSVDQQTLNTAERPSAPTVYPRNPNFDASYVNSADFGGWNTQAYSLNQDTTGAMRSEFQATPVPFDNKNVRDTISQNFYSSDSQQTGDTLRSLERRASLATSSTQGPPRGSSVSNNPGLYGSHQPYSRDNIPSEKSREQSFSSDDWQQVSPPPMTASNGKSLLSGGPAPARTEIQNEPFKREVISPDRDRKSYNQHSYYQYQYADSSIPTHIQSQHVMAATSRYEDYEEEEDDDDPWDVEMELSESVQRPPEEMQHDMSLMLSRHTTRDVSRQRTFRTFLDDSYVLATYRPSPTTSPLTDEKCCQIFCHFVAVTGPCISIFERQAPMANSSILFSNSPIPASQKALWTYTLPSLALNHRPLMHALLALSSLHIAKLQQTSTEPSMKHFLYALRRLSKLIALPKRRNEIETLAANLLVGFYEILLADHSKWNIHLNGAKKLVMEIDFASMTRRLRRMRAGARARIAQTAAHSYEDYVCIAGIPVSLLPDKDWEIDESLISQFTGLHVQYDNQWQTNTNTPAPTHEMSQKDIEDYKVRSDLYWWYCKQDIFQGMVSGNRLLMEYEHWVFCPPRGQIGKLDSTYATMDHLCLIMARLTDFGGKDQLRKRRVLAAQGGQWRPPPGHFGPGNPPAPHSKAPPGQGPPISTQRPPHEPPHAHFQTPSRPQQPSTPAPNGQPMYGMMPPPTGPIKMHSAFESMNAAIHDTGHFQPSPSSVNASPETDDLSLATASALAEHAAIVSAFDLFFRCLPEEYAPLRADTAPPISTPFGPALQYRTYPIACIWAFYYVGRILLHRLHPSMPPAAMVAAGVTAHLTRDHAQTVGKICAGLYCPQDWSLQTGNLNPSLGAALMESSFSLFFAGVQFQDPAQRGWTVSKLSTIARITGWQTSSAIAAGCEVCWEKMGLMGRGPPYTPTIARGHENERDSGQVRRGEIRREGGGGWVTPGQEKGGALSNKGGKKPVKVEEEEPDPSINHGRKYISVNPNARVHWALGIMGVEEDIKKLDLDKP